MNWLLIVVVAILLGNTLIGMKAGLIKTIFSLCSMVVAVVLTIWISPHVNDFMKGNDKIYDTISSKVEKILPLAEKEAGTSEEVSIIEGLMLPQSIKDALIENNNAKVYKAMAIDSFEEYVSGYITGVIINAMAFAITFLVIIILLWVICLSLNIISKLPLLNEVNKTGGLIAGLFHGLVVVWLFFILITVFGSTEYGQKALELIGENSLLSLIYNNNFILKFIMNATKIVF